MNGVLVQNFALESLYKAANHIRGCCNKLTLTKSPTSLLVKQYDTILFFKIALKM